MKICKLPIIIVICIFNLELSLITIYKLLHLLLSNQCLTDRCYYFRQCIMIINFKNKVVPQTWYCLKYCIGI